MATFFELAKKYEVKENKAHSTFSKGLSGAKEAFEKGEFTRRSWVKQDGNGFTVKVGKLESVYRVPTKAEVIALLDSAAEALKSNEEFQVMVETAYGEPLGVEPAIKKPRGSKSKPAAAAVVDADIITSIPLRPRT